MFFQILRSLALRTLLAAATLSLISGCCSSRYSSVCGGAPQLISIHIIDRNGMSETIGNPDRLCEYASVNFLKPQPYKKVLRVYARDAFGNTKGIITSYYENGQVQKYLEVTNNRAQGKYHEWYENGNQHLEATIIGGIADITPAAESSWVFDEAGQVWDEAGNLIATIPYCKGKQDGDTLYYHINGQIWKRCPFHEGKQCGYFQVYYKDGALLQSTLYDDNQPSGPSFRYWQCGDIAAKEIYRCGKLIEGTYYDPKGNIACTICDGSGQRAIFSATGVRELHTYSNGIPEGDVRVLDDDGFVVKTWKVLNGEKHGPEIEYYPPTSPNEPLLPKLEINWYEGKIQGPVKTWYSNGIPESQKEMSENAKNGLYTAWYKDGSLMIVEEYDNDKLVKGEYYRRNERLPISEIDLGDGVATIHNADGNFVRKVSYKHGKPYE